MISEEVYEIKDIIDGLYGCDCAYFGVDGIAIARELVDKGYGNVEHYKNVITHLTSIISNLRRKLLENIMNGEN